ncbi:MAG: hypothetical protein ACRDJ9_25625 [Dehalococcoidia bacterium]
MKQRPGSTNRWLGLVIVSGAGACGGWLGMSLMSDSPIAMLVLLGPLALVIGWANIASP